MKTEEQLVDDVFAKEGDTYGDETTTPPIDQPTARGGLVLSTLRDYVAATGSSLPVTVKTLRDLTHAQARDIVRWKLRQLAKTHGLQQIAFEPLRVQVLDFAYNSGPGLAIRWLQRVLRVDRTGQMDAPTVTALRAADAWLVHHALVAARLQMIDLWTDAQKERRAFEEGLENRALSFSLLPVP